ncbi:thermolysin metallopeptidase-like protein [Kribbella sp. VKM Ac-2571]|uniref:M4 family metallopeptidase n=1 Tax=Kribbella sp. VKM Ac-2571 TaxID=2512222 RepID=UPI00105D03D7|nr:M4 family metallopeptidase [Kribbella sp. VKM Ac-2571]TDO58925.1 thermolysin metallopeptidase-like protein [Kribbella sp. VKM Ac-2571]
MRSKTLKASVALTSAAVLTLAALAAPAADAKPPTGATTAKALVFIPNPVQSSGNEALTDQKDSATAVPRGDYYEVTLTDLDGSGYLNGTWANVKSTTGTPAYTTNGTYFYNRHDDQFEQVMAYFWGTQAQKYLQSLGFGRDLPAVNAESQDYKVDQYGQDNSFSRDDHDTITLGKGGVDDAEDGEVIVHETGHAVHDAQVPGFGSSLEAGSIGEAFGDYFAVTVGAWVAKQYGVPVAADLACVMDWDATSYTSTVPHCLRRLDAGKHYPGDVVGEVHADGEIWSQALYQIRTALGPAVADRIIVDAQFGFAPDTSFGAAARQTVATARSLYGPSQATVVQKAFADRGIL